MILSLLRRAFDKEPVIDDALWMRATQALPFIAGLPANDLARLRELCAHFLAQKEMSGAHGLALTDDMALSIAMQGCLPILNLGLEWYDDWVGIIIYPDEFVIPRQMPDENGIVHEYDEVASGEAWSGGPLLLSWADVAEAGSGYNVVIHEFAHKLDMRNGEADGMPPLHAGMSRKAWHDAFSRAYDDFCAHLDASGDNYDGWLDPYAAEHPAEFFAVVSESFFEWPQEVAEDLPEVYEQLCAFYQQNPLAKSIDK